jgi:hypothetical protein
MFAKLLPFFFLAAVALIIYEAYRCIVKKRLKTNVLIILIAAAKIILLGIPTYFIFYNITDKWVLLNTNIHPSLLTVFLCGLLFLDSYVKSNRFKK